MGKSPTYKELKNKLAQSEYNFQTFAHARAWIRVEEIREYMVRDPSSVNWLGLEQAVKGNMVPDFPLCNKSFNQSYSGHDL